MKAKKNRAQQHMLFDAPRYGWKSVQEVARGDLMVVAGEDASILGICQDGGFWVVSYVDPDTRAKTEQFYNAQDSIYVQLKQDREDRHGERSGRGESQREQ